MLLWVFTTNEIFSHKCYAVHSWYLWDSVPRCQNEIWVWPFTWLLDTNRLWNASKDALVMSGSAGGAFHQGFVTQSESCLWILNLWIKNSPLVLLMVLKMRFCNVNVLHLILFINSIQNQTIFFKYVANLWDREWGTFSFTNYTFPQGSNLSIILVC